MDFTLPQCSAKHIFERNWNLLFEHVNNLLLSSSNLFLIFSISDNKEAIEVVNFINSMAEKFNLFGWFQDNEQQNHYTNVFSIIVNPIRSWNSIRCISETSLPLQSSNLNKKCISMEESALEPFALILISLILKLDWNTWFNCENMILSILSSH